MESKYKKIDYFTALISQILVISSGGIAAGVAFLQIEEIRSSVVANIIASLITFALSLILGVFALTAIIGQADEKNPDFDQRIVRLPSLFSLIFFVGGIGTFLAAGLVHFSMGETVKAKKEIEEKKVVCPVPVPPQKINGNVVDSYFQNLPTEEQVKLVSFLQKSLARQKASAKSIVKGPTSSSEKQ